MKIFTQCECLLLSESLRLFLDDFYTSKKDCDFIISDKKIDSDKPVFVIDEKSPYLKIPFTKESLINTLEEFYSAIEIQKSATLFKAKSSSFEQNLSNLIDKFKTDLLNLIKNEYEK
ncbi:hypothetical protein [Campylobacter hyointestinalis]|uniref:Ornithine carbamoyltransferase n=1 Tax=Campylobacter hyointestinalis subsp. lawsonii TaxID=91353 RepID=A0AAV6EGL2_CAMHY|nr:hypothetical protein [Campylobacter hyointestinalis]ANE33910.1 hypothetical protein CHL_0540 [Campylobacter hyointestinalis subsp. lawsonii CCUG 27631]KAB0614163.1 ornithine carbamoyltransferase [Campylobacter hyointestinalis subsp. lawsonii]QKF69906.1 hypothetical protein CHLWT_1363 [Campylobacter hyointestinalis subsp. lawsonii]RAZ29870.1 ornithine carbamoyltransferase [Campylobacter hyointestinalis subsp. lawsonii]RAZ50472.1 ornithine carbamoyltransferase [Campylobacter hyointestinalis s